MNDYEEQSYIHATIGDLPSLRKRIRQEYPRFLINFFELQLLTANTGIAKTGSGANMI